MADDKGLSKGVPDSNGTDNEISKRLEKLEGLLHETESLRKSKALVSLAGLVLTLIAIVVFVFNIVNFGRNYDLKALAQALEKQASLLADSKEVKDIIGEVQNTCIPALRAEIVKKFKADEPTLRKELELTSDRLRDYITKDVKERVMTSLIEALAKMETDILKNNPNITTDQLDKMLKEGQDRFVENFTAKLEKRLDGIQDDVVALNASVQSFTNDPDYLALDPKCTGEYENRVIESLLELIIYQMNPPRGAMPAAIPPKDAVACCKPVVAAPAKTNDQKPAQTKENKGGAK